MKRLATGTTRCAGSFFVRQTVEAVMWWRRPYLSRRPMMTRRRSMIPYSYGGTVLLVVGGILLLLWLLGYIAI
jgi:hypothetical protein